MKKTWTSGEEITSTKLNNSQLEQMEEFVLGENIAANSAVYLKASDGKVWKCSASYSDERSTSFIGFMYEAGTTGQTKKVWIMGVASGFTGLTAGSEYYLSNTAGGIATSSGYNEKVVGIAVSTTEIRIKNAQKSALTDKAQTISGVKTFESIPEGPASDPTSDNQLTRKKYFDDTAKCYFEHLNNNINVLAGSYAEFTVTVGFKAKMIRVDGRIFSGPMNDYDWYNWDQVNSDYQVSVFGFWKTGGIYRGMRTYWETNRSRICIITNGLLRYNGYNTPDAILTVQSVSDTQITFRITDLGSDTCDWYYRFDLQVWG